MSTAHYEHRIVHVADLVEYAANPMAHPEAQIEKLVDAIVEFGFTNPVLIDEQCNLIAGHGRLAAARRVGLAEVPAIVVTDLTEERRRALVIADNRIAQDATWDEETLAAELRAIGGSAQLTGFSHEELAELLGVGAAGPDSFGEYPDLQNRDAPDYRQMAFHLSDEQLATVKRAIDSAKAANDGRPDLGNANSAALVTVCVAYLEAADG